MWGEYTGEDSSYRFKVDGSPKHYVKGDWGVWATKSDGTYDYVYTHKDNRICGLGVYYKPKGDSKYDHVGITSVY